MPIIPGDYTILIRDESAGTDCSESIEITILPPVMLTIELESVQQPSSPSANDGVITIVVTVPLTEPYTVTLNGDVFGVFTGQVISIPGLPVGQYEIQLTDANGCTSNILLVELTAFVGIHWGAGTSAFPQLMQDREKGGVAYTSVLPSTLLYADLTSHLGGFEQNWQVGLLTPVRSTFNQQTPPPTLLLQQMTTLFQTRHKTLALSSRLGGVAYINQEQALAQWSLEGKMNWLLFSKIVVEVRAGIRGRGKIDFPYLEWGVAGAF